MDLNDFLELQEQLQALMPQNEGRGLKEIVAGEETPVRIEHIKTNILSLLDEAHEALGEVGWKPWAKSRHINEAAFKGEIIDIFFFWLNLVNLAGMTRGDVETLYTAKWMKNAERQRKAGGYDGVKEKCLICGRALDDEAVTCWAPNPQNDGFCIDIGLYKAEIGAGS